MPVTIKKELFGKCKDGREVHKYTFEGSKIQVSVLDYGCAIQSVLVPDRDGKLADICLGYDNVQGYEANIPYLGVIVGRVAGRITGGKFELDGQTVQLEINNGPNSIHGGSTGFSRRLWDASVDGDTLTLNYVSPDGEEGFPGQVTMTTTYSVTEEGALTLDYTGSTSKPCPLSLTNHAYYNLAGHDSPSVFDHVAQITADNYVAVDDDKGLAPSGELPAVSGTSVDLRTPRRLGEVEAEIRAGDLDVTYTVGKAGEMKNVSKVSEPTSGRYVLTATSEPGLQFYTAKYLEVAGPVTGKAGVQYRTFNSFCLETQQYPDSVNHPHFPSTIVRPGETYRQTTVFRFGAE